MFKWMPRPIWFSVCDAVTSISVLFVNFVVFLWFSINLDDPHFFPIFLSCAIIWFQSIRRMWRHTVPRLDWTSASLKSKLPSISNGGAQSSCLQIWESILQFARTHYFDSTIQHTFFSEVTFTLAKQKQFCYNTEFSPKNSQIYSHDHDTKKVRGYEFFGEMGL